MCIGIYFVDKEIVQHCTVSVTWDATRTETDTKTDGKGGKCNALFYTGDYVQHICFRNVIDLPWAFPSEKKIAFKN